MAKFCAKSNVKAKETHPTLLKLTLLEYLLFITF